MPKDPSRFSKNALLGVILCGGASRRMRVDKATLSHHGRALWQQVAARLGPQVGQLVISTSTAQAPLTFAPLPCIIDTQADCGPLAGMASALSSPSWLEFDWLVFSSCDTPQQPVDWVGALIEASGGNGGIYYICHQGQPHYLHSLWHRSLLLPLSEFLQQGGRAVRAFYAQNQALPVDFVAVNQHDPFLNLNTPEDLARLNHD